MKTKTITARPAKNYGHGKQITWQRTWVYVVVFFKLLIGHLANRHGRRSVLPMLRPPGINADINFVRGKPPRALTSVSGYTEPDLLVTSHIVCIGASGKVSHPDLFHCCELSDSFTV